MLEITLSVLINFFTGLVVTVTVVYLATRPFWGRKRNQRRRNDRMSKVWHQKKIYRKANVGRNDDIL